MCVCVCVWGAGEVKGELNRNAERGNEAGRETGTRALKLRFSSWLSAEQSMKNQLSYGLYPSLRSLFPLSLPLTPSLSLSLTLPHHYVSLSSLAALVLIVVLVATMRKQNGHKKS